MNGWAFWALVVFTLLPGNFSWLNYWVILVIVF
jgi:hypothetical protein